MVQLKKSNSYNAYTAVTTDAYAGGQWHHVAAVITTDTSGSSGNNADIYVDGDLVGVTHNKIGPYAVSTTGWTIGTREAGYDYFFKGIIDDVRVYDEALSAEAIGALAAGDADAFLVGHWKFDGDADDSVGVNHGVVYGAQSTDGVLGGALVFDGQDDYVSLPYLAVTTTEFTITAWANALGSGGGIHHSNPIFTQRYQGSGGLLYDVPTVILYTHVADTVQAGADVRSSDGGIQNIYAASPDLGQWHHYALTVSANTITFYIDGVESASADNLQSGNYTTDIDFVAIGMHRYHRPYDGIINSGFFNGMIDDVRVYNTALSADAIADICSVLKVSVDIKPTSCPNPLNVKSKGVLPVAILGTQDFDVSLIDTASIQLNGIRAIRSSFEDVATPMLGVSDCDCTEDGPDGFIDLTLKFKTQEIVEALGEVEHGDVITLELTGVLFGEIPIEGADCILIRGRHKPINPADINKDGVVNVVDFAIFTQNWLQSSIVDD